jgi:putative salt-induced outer membrane protein YdiY
LLAAAVASVVGGTSLADSFSLNQPIYAAEAPARKPLMALLDKGGMAKPLEDAGINISGYAEVSWTHNFSDDGNTIAGRAFDFENDDPTFNQSYIAVEKTTDFAKAWDIGGKMAWTYGADARFMHSNGLFDKETPDNQIDLTELYGEVVAPLGTGLKIKIGKFITPLGYEYVNPTLNSLYSHSFLFGIVPFSHTGIVGTYALNSEWTLTAGITRGWDQSIDDNNDCIDFLGSIAYTKDKITGAVSFTVGPETTDNGDYRYAIDAWATYAMSDQLSLGINGDYIYEENTGQDGDASQVYGLAGYATYKLCDYAILNGRAEWFNDTSRASGFDSVLYEITAGVTFIPFAKNDIGSNLKIRPEVRLDMADDDVFADGTDKTQFTFGVDAYFTF